MENEDWKLTGLEYSKKLIKMINGFSQIEEIKKFGPLFQNLHSSFWTYKPFLAWQIIRLNHDYQMFIKDFWGNVPGNIFCELDFFFMDFPPLPEETFNDWNNRLDNKCADYIEKLCNKLSPPHNEKRFSVSKSNFDAFLGAFNRQFGAEVSPIPHSVRFPLPILVDAFSKYPLDELFKKRRPPKFGRNLLVYELSQAGMKNMEIARLLFGVKKSTENWPNVLKHPKLVRIADIKRVIGKIVSKAYPLCQSGQ